MSSTKQQILLLDDDPMMGPILERETGLECVQLDSLEKLLSSKSQLSPVACFVDIHLNSEKSGLEVVPMLRRSWPQAPVLVITADMSDRTIENAISAGADDFLRKPLNGREVKARLQARIEMKNDLAAKTQLRLGDISLTPAHQRLSSKTKEIYLSPTATKLLASLIEMGRKTIQRDFLKRKVWDKVTVTNNALDRKIYELRRALIEVDSTVEITNVYGEGYRIHSANEPETKEKPESSFFSIEKIQKSFATLTAPPVIRVLLIEDYAADAVLVRETLRKGDGISTFELVRTETLKQGIETCLKGNIDIVLLDLGLPDSRGLDTFLGFAKQVPEIPVIVLSGMSDHQLAVEAVAKGAQDFVSKDEIRSATLYKTIRYALLRSQVALLEKSALRESQSELQKVSDLKTQFLANMSHEIRTPMNAVIGMTSVLLTSKLDDEQRECVNTIRSSGEVLLNILNEILDFSKIQSGQIKLESSDFELRSIVEDSIDLYSAMADSKGIDLLTTIEPSLPIRVVGDPTRLRQIITNLVGNAVKFTERGAVCVNVRKGSASADSIVFEVKDSGIGIPEEELSHLFQVFHQAKGAKRFGGTGLGLAISKQLAELMHGNIRCQSIYGSGSTFTLEIPLEKSANQEQKPRPDLTDKHVIVFGATPSRTEYLNARLKDRGIDVVTASPEKSFSSLLSKSEVDLAIIETKHPSDPELKPFLDTNQKVPVLWIFPKSVESLPTAENAFVLRAPYRQSRLYEVVSKILDPKSCNQPCPKLLETPQKLHASLPILVAEDNPVNQRVVRRLLETLGLRSEIACNGLEAVHAVENRKYSAVLMDCSMPEMDGWEATREIRRKGFKLPIIAMTANAFLEDREKSIVAGMNEFLSKPVRLEDLHQTLTHFLQPSSAETGGRPLETKGGQSDLAILNLKKMCDANSLEQESDQEFIKELMELFMEAAPPTFVELRKNLTGENPERLKSQAHRLKGLALNLGAERLAELCAELEQIAQKKDASLAQSKEERLVSEWDKLLKEVKQELAN